MAIYFPQKELVGLYIKYLDRIKVIKNKEIYFNNHIFKGTEGTIISAEIRNNSFEVVFSKETGEDYASLPILISDLELVSDNGLNDKENFKSTTTKQPRMVV